MKSMMPMAVMMVLLLVAIYFVYQGINMHSMVGVEEGKFHALLESYFANSKSVRDAADSGSNLTADLTEIQKYPSELLRLKLVGIGNILTGIFIVLIGILMALIMMPVRLKQAIKQNQ